MYRVDLNSDIGELLGEQARLRDCAIMDHVSSVNVACGFHAGNPQIMERTVAYAAETGVAVGAHPGFPDKEGFGRREMEMSPEEIKSIVRTQIEALKEITDRYGIKLQHVKPHGALYNMSAKDLGMAIAIAEAICEVDKDIKFMGLSGSRHIEAAETVGLKSISEVFADRAYMDDGSLMPRNLEGAVIHHEDDVIRRALRMAKEGIVTSADGKDIAIKADSICVHGDTEEAVRFVTEIKAALIAEGVEVCCPGRE